MGYICKAESVVHQPQTSQFSDAKPLGPNVLCDTEAECMTRLNGGKSPGWAGLMQPGSRRAYKLALPASAGVIARASETLSFLTCPYLLTRGTYSTPLCAGCGLWLRLRLPPTIFVNILCFWQRTNVLIRAESGLWITPLGKRVCITLGIRRV